MMCSASDGAHVAGLEGWVSGAGDCAAWCKEGYEEPVSSTCRAVDGFTSGDYVRLLSVAHGEYLAPGASGAPPSFVDPVTVTTRPVAAALPVFQMLFDETGRPEANSKPWILGGVRFKGIPGSSHAGQCWMNTVSSSQVWSGCDQSDAVWTLTQFDRSDGLAQGTAKLGGQMYRVSLRNGVDETFGKPVRATVCPQGGEKCHDCDMTKDCEICTLDASGRGRWGRRTCPADRACRSGHSRVLVGANVLPYHAPGTPHPADAQSCNFFSRCLHRECSP